MSHVLTELNKSQETPSAACPRKSDSPMQPRILSLYFFIYTINTVTFLHNAMY